MTEAGIQAPYRLTLRRAAHVLLVWAGASLLTLLLARLGAQDTPATPWGQAAPSWAQHVMFWDSGWYERILTEGYPHVLPQNAGTVEQNSWAFYPLLPWLASLLMMLGLSFAHAGTVISLISSAVLALELDAWLSPRTGATPSLWAVGFMWCGPCALILQVPYGEALSLALLCGTLIAISRRHYLLAAPLAAAACLARPIGVPLAATLGVWWLWQAGLRRRSSGQWSPTWGRKQHVVVGADDDVAGGIVTTRQWLGLGAVTLWTGLATFAWPIAAWVVTGRMDAYTATEAAWRGKSITPVWAWVDAAGAWVGPHLAPLLALGVWGLALAGLSARSLRRLGALPWLWCLMYSLYLLAVFYPTTSLLRLLLPLAPACWALAGATEKVQRPTVVRMVILGVAIVAQIFWISWVWDFGSVRVSWVP